MLQEKRRTRTRRRWSNALAIATIAISTIAAGCSDGVKTVPVKGRVTLGGGNWPRRGIIYFACSEPAAGYSRRSGVGDFDVDGAFVVTSYKKGDGLTPGKYVVNIECWEVPPSMGAGPPAKSAVPVKYQRGDTSGFTLEVDISAGRVTDANFDVPLE